MDPLGAEMEQSLLEVLPLIESTAVEIDKMMESQRKVGGARCRKCSSTMEVVKT